ncbi:MAG: DUF1559 domain-containing protein [Fimbriimonadaceae bacterium]|nr:DUF1559 domain-containing protein [Fimbriimonadaceae bacterium]
MQPPHEQPRRTHQVSLLPTALLLLPVLLGTWLLWRHNGRAPDEDARRAVCAVRLGQLGRALLLYAADYDQRFPRNAEDVAHGGGPEAPNTISPRWYYGVLHPYLRDRQAWHCPNVWVTSHAEFSQSGSDSKAIALMPDSLGRYFTGYAFWAGHCPPGTAATDPASGPLGRDDSRPPAAVVLVNDWVYQTAARHAPAHHDVGANSVYLDGHVSWSPLAALNHQLPVPGWGANCW